METRKFVSWRRVSTQKQGRSGLGLEAQESIIKFFVDEAGGELISDFKTFDSECSTNILLIPS